MRLGLLFLLVVLALPAQAEALRVIVSIPPLASLLSSLGGDQVAVEVLLPAGADPHHYAPTPRRVRALADADLLVWAGAPYEGAWRARAVVVAPGVPSLQLVPSSAEEQDDHAAHHHDHHHEDHHQAPHAWTSLTALRSMVQTMAMRLSVLRPSQQAFFVQQQQRLDVELAAAQQQIREQLARSAQRHFLVFHPAWAHFAEEFGLTQLAIEQHGKSPSARQLASLIAQARALGIRDVFVQPQFDRRSAQTVASALQGEIVEMDPLSADMPATLLRLAETLAGDATGE